VSDDLRQAAATALAALATSPDHRDRADAGRALAGFAEVPGAQELLLHLVLDADDTFVTLHTAAALLRRHDRIGLAVVARAMARAEPDQAEWIGTALREVLCVFAAELDVALSDAEALLREARGPDRAGLETLVAELAGATPILRPVDGDRSRG
jgi:hypothetical protein